MRGGIQISNTTKQFMNGELQVVNNLLLLPSKSDNVGHRKYFMYLWRYVRNE